MINGDRLIIAILIVVLVIVALVMAFGTHSAEMKNSINWLNALWF